MWKWQNGVAEGRQKISKLNIGNNNGILGARVCQLCWLTWCSSLLLVGMVRLRLRAAYGFIDLLWCAEVAIFVVFKKKLKFPNFTTANAFSSDKTLLEKLFYSSLKVGYCYSFFWLQILSGKYSFKLLLARLFFTFQWRETFFVSKLIFLEMLNLTISIRVRLTSHCNQYLDK